MKNKFLLGLEPLFSRCVEMPIQRRTQGKSNECQQGALRGLLGVRPTDSLSCRGSQNLGKLAYRISNSRFFSILIAHRMRLPTNPVGRKTYLRVSRGPGFPLIGIWIDPPLYYAWSRSTCSVPWGLFGITEGVRTYSRSESWTRMD